MSFPVELVWLSYITMLCPCSGHYKEAGQASWGGAGCPRDCASTDQRTGAAPPGTDRGTQAGEAPTQASLPHTIFCSCPCMGLASFGLPWPFVQVGMCCVQGAEVSEAQGSDEIRKLQSELETSKAKADGHQHALQELSGQAKACSRPSP